MSPRMRLGQRKEMVFTASLLTGQGHRPDRTADTAPHHPARATRSAAPQSSRQPLWAAFGNAIPVRKQGDCLFCAGFFSGFTQDYSSISSHKNLYWPIPGPVLAGFCGTPPIPPMRVATPGREVGWVSAVSFPPAESGRSRRKKEPPAEIRLAASVTFMPFFP